MRCNGDIKSRSDKNLSDFNKLVVEEYKKYGLNETLARVESQTIHQTESLVHNDAAHKKAFEKMSLAEKNVSAIEKAMKNPSSQESEFAVADLLMGQKDYYADMQNENRQLEKKFDAKRDANGERVFKGSNSELKTYNQNKSLLRSEKIRQLSAARDLLWNGIKNSDLAEKVNADYTKSEDDYSETYAKLETQYYRQQYNANIAKSEA